MAKAFTGSRVSCGQSRKVVKMNFTLDDEAMKVGGELTRIVQRLLDVLEAAKDGQLMTNKQLMAKAGYTQGGRGVNYTKHPALQEYRYPRKRGQPVIIGDQLLFVVWGNKATIKAFSEQQEQA